MISIQEVLDSNNNLDVVYKINAVPDVPTWNDFIAALNYKFNNPTSDIDKESDGMFIEHNGKQTDIFIYNQFDPQFWKAVQSESSDNLFPQSDKFISFIQNVIGDCGWTIKSLINFVGNESQYSAHKDSQDVVSWQCIGNVEYRIYEDFECNFYEPVDVAGKKYRSFLLQPGDVIYMPAGVIHQAIVTEPRATLILDRF